MDVNLTQEDSVWELMWAPYDQPTYQSVLDLIYPDDVVLEIGAGDLRLARQIARIARRVYAIEIQREILDQGLSDRAALPANLTVFPGDACPLPFPRGVSVGVLLMRHCTHFTLYAERLKSIGCKRLITNSRWRLGVEVVDLLASRESFDSVRMGWYACWCGAVGFIPGPVESYSAKMDQIVHEVSSCPRCSSSGQSISLS
ncbi:MAG: rRNA adenine methyltransferase [Chloroflexi bacterium]|nr:rRNA adenine methyltransferase [Chloroflexota bacterium]